MRPRINEKAVEDYREAYEEKKPLPPIMVIRGPGGELWPGDGHIRIEAAKLAGFKHIEARVYDGTLRDALAYSVGANSAHGQPRDMATKRNSVETLLNDPVWSKMSLRQISDAAAVSPHFAKKIIDEWHASKGTEKPKASIGKDGKVRSTEGKPKAAPDQSESNGELKSPVAPSMTVPVGAKTADPVAPTVHVMDDDEWLETMPIRKELDGVRLKSFDRTALEYRAIVESPAYAELKKLVISTLEIGRAHV